MINFYVLSTCVFQEGKVQLTDIFIKKINSLPKHLTDLFVNNP